MLAWMSKHRFPMCLASPGFTRKDHQAPYLQPTKVAFNPNSRHWMTILLSHQLNLTFEEMLLFQGFSTMRSFGVVVHHLVDLYQSLLSLSL